MYYPFKVVLNLTQEANMGANWPARMLYVTIHRRVHGISNSLICTRIVQFALMQINLQYYVTLSTVHSNTKLPKILPFVTVLSMLRASFYL